MNDAVRDEERGELGDLLRATGAAERDPADGVHDRPARRVLREALVAGDVEHRVVHPDDAPGDGPAASAVALAAALDAADDPPPSPGERVLLRELLDRLARG